jgi:hypothetical protein
LRAQTATKRCAHEPGFGRFANAGEVKPVSIPASADRGIFTQLATCVPTASFLQQVQTLIGQIEKGAAQACRVFGPAFTVPIIRAIILASRIVKDGKETYHLDNGAIARGNI